MDQAPPKTDIAEAVCWAYRLLLGREPESDTVITAWTRLSDARLIRDHFLASEEFHIQRASSFAAQGNWIHGPVTEAAIAAAHALLHGEAPSAEDLDMALARHIDLASLRQSFLAVLEPGAAGAPLPGALQDHRFAFLGRNFTLRGEAREEYWRTQVQSGPEPGVTRLARILRAAFPGGGDDCMLVDAGANLGMASVAMAAALPRHQALICVEPDPRSAALLRHNLARNGLAAARCFQVALGDANGTARMRRARSNTATNLILASESRAQVKGADVVEVPMRRLDSLLREEDVTRLDVLKIDVEGGEAAVLRGAAKAIERHRPLVHVEFNLWTQMTVGARNPLEVLEEWRASYRHLVAFKDDGAPLSIHDADGLLWVLHSVLTRRGGVDDIVLCDRLDWLDRWA